MFVNTSCTRAGLSKRCNNRIVSAFNDVSTTSAPRETCTIYSKKDGCWLKLSAMLSRTLSKSPVKLQSHFEESTFRCGDNDNSRLSSQRSGLFKCSNACWWVFHSRIIISKEEV